MINRDPIRVESEETFKVSQLIVKLEQLLCEQNTSNIMNSEQNTSNIMNSECGATNTTIEQSFDYNPVRRDYTLRMPYYHNPFGDKVVFKHKKRKTKTNIRWHQYFLSHYVKQKSSRRANFSDKQSEHLALTLPECVRDSSLSTSSWQSLISEEYDSSSPDNYYDDSYYMQTGIDEGTGFLHSIESKDDIWHMLESMVLFYEDVSRSKNPKEVTLSCLRMVKMLCHGSLINKVIQSKYFTQIVSSIEDEMQTFTENLDGFRNMIDFMANFKKTEIYKKVYRLCMYILTLSIFDKFGLTFDAFGYSLFEADAMKKKYYSRPQFLFALMDTLSFLMKKGLQIIQTGRVDAIFHSGDSYAKWFDKVQDLKLKSKVLCNPEAHGFDEFSFRADLDTAIDAGESILIAIEGQNALEKRLVRGLLNELKSLKYDLTTKTAARARRDAPFSILICGGSGIGKSTLKDLFRFHYAKVKNLDENDTFCYTKHPTAKFWDGYTTSQWCVILDDIAFMAPRVAPNGDPSCMEFLQIINPVPHTPDQAALEDKGRTPLRCKLVIGTTNTPNLNAHYYFACPSAAQRRFPYLVHAEPKDEYKNADGMLDPTKVPDVEVNKYPDLWHFKVEKVKPRPFSMSQYSAETEVVLKTSKVDCLMDWYAERIIAFDESQLIVEKAVMNMRSVPICTTCMKLTCACPRCDDCLKRSCICEKYETYPEVCVICTNDPCNCKMQTSVSFTGILGLIVRINHFIHHIFTYTLAFLFFHDVFFYAVHYSIPIVSEWLFSFQTMIMNRFMGRLVQEQRRRVIRIGTLLRERYNPVYAVTAFAMLFTAYNIFKLYEPTMQTREETTQEVGTPPVVGLSERTNVWYKDDFELSSYHLNPTITSSKGIDTAKFKQLVAANTCTATISNTIHKQNLMNLICLKGNYYLTNNHHFDHLGGAHKFQVIFQPGKDGVTRNQSMFITEKNLIRNIESDLCILHLPNIPPKKGLVMYIPDSITECRNNGFYVIRSSRGTVDFPTVDRIRPVRSESIPNFKGTLWGGISSQVTQVGDCGSPLFAKTELGYILLGIHVLGNGSSYNVGAAPIQKDWILANLPIDAILPGEPMMVAQTAKCVVGSLHHKSVFRYIDKGSAEVYGSFIGSRVGGKSRVEATPIAKALSKHGYETKYGPPVMKGYEPWRIAALESVNPKIRFDNDVIHECVEALVSDILGDNMDLSTLHVYDDFTAINGAASIAYVEKINRNTSAGFPWRKSKKFFLKSVPPRYGLQDPVEPTPEIMERVNEMYHRYKSGQRVMPVFTAHLKDEAVSFKKIEAKKTRVFAGAPFDWTILVRKYFLSTIRLVQNNRYTFESGPGTVAQSYEWHEMYDHLTHFGSDRIVAGDYKAFDKSMSSVFILAAFRILIRINMASGNFTADDERVMWGIANDVAFPVMDFNGDFVQFFGSNPSGHPLTVIINGLVNSLYLRYVYYHLNPDHVVNTFRANVRLFTYGDDNIMGVSICAPWFNHSAIASVLDTCGIVYTMADKESKSVPYINMKDATFLKRSWSYDKDVGAYLAPLDHDSIERQMMVWVRSKSVSAQEQIIDIIAGVTREYFFYGRKTFERKQLMLKEIVAQTELEPWVVESTFPSWKSLHDEFWENSKRVGCLPPWREAEMQTHGFVDKSQPKATVLGSYCTDQLFHDTNVSECGSSMTSQGRSPNTLFSVGVCGAPEVFMELCESLSQPRNFNRLTNTKSTSGLSPKDNMDTLYDVHTVGDNTNVHTLDDFLDSTYTMQSLEEKITTSGENLNQQTIGFTDEVGGDNTSIPAPINYVMSAGAVNAELGDYLSRPTEIIRFTWAEAGTIGATFEPWELFFDQAAVRKKLDNFYLLQCNLKLKIVINASQFYYGALLASYQPLSLFNPAPIAASTGEEEMVLYSQRPHVDLYPQNCQGGELTLPFIYHREWLNITSRANLQDMGSLIFKSYTPLLNANGVVGTGCDVVVYAWAEDVRLCGPTVKLSLQSKTKDEYNDDGVISKPASAIAKATGDLGNIPVIGPFMTATSAVAGTVGKIANIFGFTNPPVLDDVHAFKSTAFPNLATTDIGVPYEKLTLDAKNELSIDPRICGADLGDEMQIHSFASRESFLRSLTWSTTSVRTVPLMTMRATPILARFTTQTGQKTLYKTPMMHIAQMFKYWRGDIKVRIKVICSPYHKGRLRISYDPIGDIDTNLTGDTQNQVYTEILDIADNTDCTFNIPYVQDLAYMETGPEASQGAYNNAAGTLTPTTNEGIVNGVITISPLTVLTSPVTPSEVRLLVYVSAGDNFELADPISIPGDYSYYTIQGDVSYTSAPEDVILIGGHTSTTDDNINLVYMGESVKSLRTLCHRGTLHSVMQEFAEVTPTYGVATYYHVIPRRPRFPGFDIDGGEFADTVLVAGTHPYNWVNWTAMTWLEPCFVGQRGSINWVSHPQQQRENRTSISLNREHTTLSTFDYYGFYEGANTRDSISREYIIQGTRTMEGAGVNSQGVQNTVHCVAPFYANVKFQTTSANARNRGIAADGSNKDAIRATAVFSPLNVEPNATASQASSGFTSFYVSSGVDYNLIFFLNVPVTYKYNFIPSAP